MGNITYFSMTSLLAQVAANSDMSFRANADWRYLDPPPADIVGVKQSVGFYDKMFPLPPHIGMLIESFPYSDPSPPTSHPELITGPSYPSGMNLRIHTHQQSYTDILPPSWARVARHISKESSQLQHAIVRAHIQLGLQRQGNPVFLGNLNAATFDFPSSPAPPPPHPLSYDDDSVVVDMAVLGLIALASTSLFPPLLSAVRDHQSGIRSHLVLLNVSDLAFYLSHILIELPLVLIGSCLTAGVAHAAGTPLLSDMDTLLSASFLALLHTALLSLSLALSSCLSQTRSALFLASTISLLSMLLAAITTLLPQTASHAFHTSMPSILPLLGMVFCPVFNAALFLDFIRFATRVHALTSTTYDTSTSEWTIPSSSSSSSSSSNIISFPSSHLWTLQYPPNSTANQFSSLYPSPGVLLLILAGQSVLFLFLWVIIDALRNDRGHSRWGALFNSAPSSNHNQRNQRNQSLLLDHSECSFTPSSSDEHGARHAAILHNVTLPSPSTGSLLRSVWRSPPTPPESIVRNLNLSFEWGSITTLVTPTPPMSSALCNALCGLLAPSRGHVSISGVLAQGGPNNVRAIRKLVAYSSSNDVVWPQLSVKETLALYARFRNLSGPQLHSTVADTLHTIRLEHIKDSRVDSLSPPTLRLLSLGLCLVGGPDVIVLELPLRGLDKYHARQVCDIISDVRSRLQKTFIITALSTPATTTISDVIVTLNQEGTLAFLGSPSQFLATATTHSMPSHHLSSFSISVSAKPSAIYAIAVNMARLAPEALSLDNDTALSHTLVTSRFALPVSASHRIADLTAWLAAYPFISSWNISPPGGQL